MRRVRELSVPPRLRTLEDDDGERRATWLELFVDLVFVVAVAQLSNGLATHDTVHGFLVFAALWVAVWWAGWASRSMPTVSTPTTSRRGSSRSR